MYTSLLYLAFTSVGTYAAQDCHADNCLREMQDARFSSLASTFCKTYTKCVNTKPTAIPSYLENCGMIPSAVSSACSCFVTPTTTAKPLPTSTCPVYVQPTCAQDNCLRAVIACGQPPFAASASKDCSSFAQVTVTPKAVTLTSVHYATRTSTTRTSYDTISTSTTSKTLSTATSIKTNYVTSQVTSTSIETDVSISIETDSTTLTLTSIESDLSTSIETDYITVTSTSIETDILSSSETDYITILPKRSVSACASIPKYASACPAVANYASACSCIGYKATTHTAATPTVTKVYTSTLYATKSSIILVTVSTEVDQTASTATTLVSILTETVPLALTTIIWSTATTVETLTAIQTSTTLSVAVSTTTSTEVDVTTTTYVSTTTAYVSVQPQCTQGSTYTAADGHTLFTESCYTTFSGYEAESSTEATFESCMDSCAENNDNAYGSCVGISYDQSNSLCSYKYGILVAGETSSTTVLSARIVGQGGCIDGVTQWGDIFLPSSGDSYTIFCAINDPGYDTDPQCTSAATSTDGCAQVCTAANIAGGINGGSGNVQCVGSAFVPHYPANGNCCLKTAIPPSNFATRSYVVDTARLNPLG